LRQRDVQVLGGQVEGPRRDPDRGSFRPRGSLRVLPHGRPGSWPSRRPGHRARAGKANRGDEVFGAAGSVKTPEFPRDHLGGQRDPVDPSRPWLRRAHGDPAGLPAASPPGRRTARRFASIERTRGQRPASIAFRSRIAALSRKRRRTTRPSREEGLESWARPGAKARSVRSYRVHRLNAPQTVQGRHAAGVDRVPFRIPEAVAPPSTRGPCPAAMTDGGGPARIRSSPIRTSSSRAPGPRGPHRRRIRSCRTRAPADRVDVQGEAAAVRAARGVPAFGWFPLPSERHVACVFVFAN